MKDELIKILDSTNPKHIGHAVKRNQQLHAWICEQTQEWPNLNLSQRIRCIIHHETPICEKSGAIRRWKSITDGFGFCGVANSCECAREHISNSVSESNKSFSTEKKNQIHQKRTVTNIERYGIANSGQTVHAKQSHAQTYANASKVKNIVDNIKKTNLGRYGVANPMQLDQFKEKIKQTNIAKYGKPNVMQDPVIISKSVQTRKERYEPHYLARQNYSRFCQNVLENFGVKVLLLEDDYIGVQSRPEMPFECIACHTQFNKRFDYASPPICKVCYPGDIRYKSDQELEILEYIKSIYSDHIISGERRLISPYEIDIYIPQLQIGIEYCGLYWHSEKSGNKSWNYHARKHNAAGAKNVRLITIFSDEWIYRKDVVKQYLKVLLKLESNSIYARKCEFKIIDHETARAFIDINHLIGAPHRISWAGGLYHNQDLIAVMTFINQSNGTYILNRYSTSLRVVGGASRLLKKFINEINPKQIISFSDNRFSQGNLYKKLGFTASGVVPPMQSYVKNYDTRYHKLSLNKKKILSEHANLDHNQTEWQLLQSLGYDRIWDCGKLKWELYI